MKPKGCIESDSDRHILFPKLVYVVSPNSDKCVVQQRPWKPGSEHWMHHQ